MGEEKQPSWGIDGPARRARSRMEASGAHMSTKLPDVSTDGESRVANHAAEWVGEGSASLSAAETLDQCGACGDPAGAHQLLLTVDWVDYLVDEHSVRTPEKECSVPLCTRCRSWAEMIEIAEMNINQHSPAEREKIIRERNRFLESLQVQLISNFPVSESLSVF